MIAVLNRSPAVSDKGQVLTKATIKAAERLGLSQKALGNVIGLSESVVSRMKSGDYVLGGGKPYELAALLVRLYRSLDAIVAGDEIAARAWMKNHNLALRGSPAELIQKIQGLFHVVQYLDTRRAPV
ncbi:MbcA/ParS/Xre antitoxin family protein [Rhodopseudomonas sp. HC1]|uniref:MbcA/ParS/Xre antitoxin family protein n=1 Tax=Rhodopseudomonas infernalis TaxID=2897386 RepID=UPI001EE7E388|nr:MbcA/ParS/Xre antitoxin family protein [Rhodopseudomonas infernalis]MCG6205715.1 MbcA/ParS/Xre antitoxin family protein [Rhodopseudomonas infernalis]